MKKRILYIILGVMLFANVGVGQITIQPGPYNFIYNGSDQFPTRSASCSGLNFNFSTRFLDASNNPLPGLTRPRGAGSYTMIVELSGDCVEQQSVSFTINKATPTITITSGTYTYSGSSQGPGVTETNTGGSTSVPTFSYVGTSGTIYGPSQVKPTNAGSYLVTASVVTDANYFAASSVATSFIINKKPLTITIDASDKVYDGITYANPTITSDKLGYDIIDIFSSSAFNNKNIGIGKVVTTSIASITGTDAGNYSLTSATATGTASITVRSLTISATASDKVYDGNTTANVTLTDNKITGDDVIVNKTATFNSKNIGTGKSVAVSGINLTGADAGNYTLTSATATGTASITVKSLTISATASDKIYDGNTNANVTLTDNKITGDDVTVNKTATFNNKNIGTGKAVTVSGMTLTGADAGNYTLTNATTTSAGTASITVRSLTISATATDKVYDGNTTANVTLTVNKITGDDVTVNKTATFNNKNIGIDKAVAVSGITLTGADAGNYTLTSSTATGTASITVRSLTISATALDKIYDGNTTVNATLTDNKITGDDVTVNKTAKFNNKNIGIGKAVTVSGINLTGADAGNYTITSSTATGTASITVRSLTISATVSDKIYDGNNTASVTLTDNRIAGDVFTVDKTATFNSKNIGTGKAVTVSGIILTGTDAGNYTLTNATTTSAGTASITVRSLTITATISDKMYDGNTNANVTLTDNKITDDDVTVNKTATFNNKNIGTGKAVTVNGIALTGTDAGNYTITSAIDAGTASITVRSLTISATASDKVYDGNTTANITLTDNKITGDDVTVNKTATFNNKNIGTGKAVTVSGITLTGTDAGNYTITSAIDAGTASITVRSLTISATASDKVYDGNTTAIASLTDNRLTGDDLTVNKTGVTFSNKNAGSSKTVNIIGITLAGTDAGNYTITNATATGTASITAKSLTISATAANKEYDGNMNATVVFSDNRISGDVLTVNKNEAKFNNKNVGVGKTVTINGINLTGTDAGNYSLISSTNTGIASITAKKLTVSAIAKNKPYDGNKKAEVTLSDNKISGDLITSSYTLAEFESPEPNDNKLVTVSGISISGVDAGNYSLTNTTATASANITGSPIPFAVPNAFTPNGDGKNDKFKIIFNNTTGVTLRLQIYNRNGILMFSTSDISEEWDGRYKNVMQDMGIYFVKYRIEIAGGATYEDTPRLYLFK